MHAVFAAVAPTSNGDASLGRGLFWFSHGGMLRAYLLASTASLTGVCWFGFWGVLMLMFCFAVM